MAAVCVVVLMLAASVQAQDLGAIEGGVKDPTGTAVGGARVMAERPGGTVYTTRSDFAGRFRIDGLPPGRYTVRVHLTGFSAVARSVDVGSATVALDVTLESLTASESLVVTGERADMPLNQPSQAASRLELTARETPATVDVVTFTDSQARGLRTTIEALTAVPGVNSANLPSTPGITMMRGFTGGAISLLFDGIRISTLTMVTRNVDVWSFEQIEILKGPASVLYGEGALAGVVNLVPKRPSFGTRRAEAFASFGSFDTLRLAAGAAGPINDQVAYRVDASFGDSRGYIDGAGPSTLALAGAIEVRLGRAGTLSLSVDYFGDDYGNTYWGTPLVSAGVARDPSDLVKDSRGFVIDKALRRTNYNVSDGRTEADATWTRAKLRSRPFRGWRLDNDLYYYDADRSWKNSEAYTFSTATNSLARSTAAIRHDHRFYGNRLAVSNDALLGARRNRFTAGLEANRNDFVRARRFGETTSVDPYALVQGSFPAETPDNFPGIGNFVDFTSDPNLVAVFAENAFNLASRVLIVGGVRYDHLDVRRSSTDHNLGTTTSFDKAFNPVSWRIGSVFDLAPNVQAFGQYSNAVAAVANVLLISQTNLAFDLTTGDSWEGGIKASLLGNRVNATGAVFRIRQDDILTRDPNNANIMIQGGAQRSTGAEVSMRMNLTRDLRVDVSSAIMNAEFVTLVEDGNISRGGNVPPDVPEHTANIWASYMLPGVPATVSGGMRWVGRYFLNNANTSEVRDGTMVDAAVSFRIGRRTTVTGRIRNLTDTLWADWSGASANQVLLVAPRSVDLSLSVTF